MDFQSKSGSIVLGGGWTVLMAIFMVLTGVDRSEQVFVPLVSVIVVLFLGLVGFIEVKKIEFDRRVFWLVSVLLRVIILFFPVGLSDDVFRYLWDGYLQHQGLNPYLYSPDNVKLIDYRTPWWPRINNADIPTPYPPGSQLIFYVLTLNEFGIDIQIILLRLVVIVADVMVIILLERIGKLLEIPHRRIIYYAWSPLAILEFAGNAHNDVFALLFMLSALYLILRYDRGSRWQMLAAVSLGIGVSVKYFPLVLLLFVRHKWHVREYFIFLFSITCLSLPYLVGGVNPLLPRGQMIFLNYFRFNESINRIIYFLPGINQNPIKTRDIYFFLMLAVVIYSVLSFNRSSTKDRNIGIYAINVLFVSFLLGPDIQPWYLLWILPLAAMYLDIPIIIYSCSVLLSYAVYPTYDLTGEWRESVFILILEYLPVYSALVYYYFIKPRSYTDFQD